MKTSYNIDDDDYIDMLIETETYNNVSELLPILNDLEDLKFRLTSYYETEGSDDYKLGVEQGLMLASKLLETIIKKYS